MATAYLKNVETGELLAVDKPSARYTALTTAPEAGVSRNVPITRTPQWEEVTLGSGGGSAVEVFEVTDLLIPAGTDLHNEAIEIGSFSFEAGQHVAITSVYLEIAEPAADDMLLIAADSLDWDLQTNVFPYFSFDAIIGGASNVVARGSGLETILGDRLSATPASGFFDPAVPPTWPFVMHVGISGVSASTPADITVVRARAAFLLI